MTKKSQRNNFDRTNINVYNVINIVEKPDLTRF